jgi:hypothetical protein
LQLEAARIVTDLPIFASSILIYKELGWQSLGIIKCKLLFPRMVKKGFVAEISNDPNLYFYNGMSAYLKN